MSVLKAKGILLPVQKNLLVEMSKIKETSFFYLTGGTALSEFYLAHRRSYDLDLFTSQMDLIPHFTRILEEKVLKGRFNFRITRKFESLSLPFSHGGRSEMPLIFILF